MPVTLLLALHYHKCIIVFDGYSASVTSMPTWKITCECGCYISYSRSRSILSKSCTWNSATGTSLFSEWYEIPFLQKCSWRMESFLEDIDCIVPESIRQIVVADNDESSRLDSFEWLPLHAPEDIMKAQREDDNLRIIITWLENNVEPTKAELNLSSQDVRHYWLMKDRLFFSNWILYYRWEDALEPRILLVVVPASLCDDVCIFLMKFQMLVILDNIIPIFGSKNLSIGMDSKMLVYCLLKLVQEVTRINILNVSIEGVKKNIMLDAWWIEFILMSWDH